jgi:hypothetical protein
MSTDQGRELRVDVGMEVALSCWVLEVKISSGRISSVVSPSGPPLSPLSFTLALSSSPPERSAYQRPERV